MSERSEYELRAGAPVEGNRVDALHASGGSGSRGPKAGLAGRIPASDAPDVQARFEANTERANLQRRPIAPRTARGDRRGARPDGADPVLAEGRRPLRCLLTTLSPERSLSRALVQHLADELPGIQFRLRLPESGAEPDALWVCGYRPGHAELVARLRRRHREAALIVTGRAPIDGWESEVLRAGADSACTWPLPYTELSALLRQRL